MESKFTFFVVLFLLAESATGLCIHYTKVMSVSMWIQGECSAL